MRVACSDAVELELAPVARYSPLCVKASLQETVGVNAYRQEMVDRCSDAKQLEVTSSRQVSVTLRERKACGNQLEPPHDRQEMVDLFPSRAWRFQFSEAMQM